MGSERSRSLFTALTLLPFAASILLAITAAPALIAVAALPFAISAILTVRRGATGAALIPVLGMNGRAMLIWSVLTAIGLTWGGFTLFDATPYLAHTTSF